MANLKWQSQWNQSDVGIVSSHPFTWAEYVIVFGRILNPFRPKTFHALSAWCVLYTNAVQHFCFHVQSALSRDKDAKRKTSTLALIDSVEEALCHLSWALSHLCVVGCYIYQISATPIAISSLTKMEILPMDNVVPLGTMRASNSVFVWKFLHHPYPSCISGEIVL